MPLNHGQVPLFVIIYDLVSRMLVKDQAHGGPGLTRCLVMSITLNFSNFHLM